MGYPLQRNRFADLGQAMLDAYLFSRATPVSHRNTQKAAQRIKDRCGGQSQCRSPVQLAATSIRVEWAVFARLGRLSKRA